jgi:histidine triad (HIT) family protein
MNPCIFCKILAGEAAGSFVYQDELVAAFMDIHQPNPYKVLVVPRAHAEMIYDLDDAQAAAVMQASVRIARAIREVTKCEGLSVFQSNGAVAGQEVWHFHIHLLPRFANDKHQQRQDAFPKRATLDRLAADLRAKLPS